jgi:hypothetical protein
VTTFRKLAAAGDRLTDFAKARLRQHLGEHWYTRVCGEGVVRPAAKNGDSTAGQHCCIDCGDLFVGTRDAREHDATHRLAWRSFTTGYIEAHQ